MARGMKKTNGKKKMGKKTGKKIGKKVGGRRRRM